MAFQKVLYIPILNASNWPFEKAVLPRSKDGCHYYDSNTMQRFRI